MRIAIPSIHSGLDGQVAQKMGTAKYLLIVNTTDMSLEVAEPLPAASGPGAGIAVMNRVVELGAKAVLIGHVAPHIAAAMEKQGIRVAMDVSGTVQEAVGEFLRSSRGDDQSPSVETNSWATAASTAGKQFTSLIPRLVGIIMLLGLFRGFISKEMLFSLFPGSTLLDSILGAGIGSILTGNPVNSYVIGDSLLRSGVGLAGVSALMLAWVNVGMIRLPLEAEALGKRFAIVRNLAGFFMAIILSLLIGMWGGLA